MISQNYLFIGFYPLVSLCKQIIFEVYELGSPSEEKNGEISHHILELRLRVKGDSLLSST